MSNYLVDHAIANVWSTPEQDRQAIIKPGRISKPLGETTSFKILLRKYLLPNTTSIFHVYQIGQVFPVILNIFPKVYEWVSAQDCCNTNQMVVEVYNDRGIKLPNFSVYYRYLDGNNLVFAIEEKNSIAMDYQTEDIYINFYSDAYFLKSESNSLPIKIFNSGTIATKLTDIASFNDLVNEHKAMPGNVIAYINGMFTTEVSVATAKIGDCLELIHDGSIYDVVDIPVASLLEFNSTKDLARKYLVHLPVDPTDTENDIKFMDDNSYYLYHTDSLGKSKGVMYHRNSADSVRMLTHRDYSILVDEVVALKKGIPDWSDQTTLTFRLYIRHAGYNRALVYEKNRIHELYKMQDTDIKAAMVGLDATVSSWQADTLENAGYAEIMNYLHPNFTPDLVEKAYGYDAIAKLIGNAMIKTENFSGQLIARIPYGLQENAVIFEYDTNGLFLGYYQHSNASTYVCHNATASIIEAVVGIASQSLDEYNTRSLPLNPKYNYKFYSNLLNAGVDENKWADVTDDGVSYAVSNGSAIWLNSSIIYKVLIRSDKNVLCYTTNIDTRDGTFKFNILQTLNGILQPLTVPPGELDIILNTHTLVEGVDYIMNFPTVNVISKKYLVNPDTQTQTVVVRAKGFPNKDLSLISGEDIGFIQYGMLSRNNKYDLTEDRVLKAVVGGAVFAVGDLRTFEDHSAVSVPNATDGSPYEIKEIVVPSRGLTPSSMYDLRVASKQINKDISNYLTKKLPQYVPPGVFTITSRYYLFSPFCNKIIYDIMAGKFASFLPKLQDFYNDTYVATLCLPYMSLLDYDPATTDHQLDDAFVYVHPHNLDRVLDMNVYYYNFLSRAIKLYLNNKVSLSGFLRVTA